LSRAICACVAADHVADPDLLVLVLAGVDVPLGEPEGRRARAPLVVVDRQLRGPQDALLLGVGEQLRLVLRGLDDAVVVLVEAIVGSLAAILVMLPVSRLETTMKRPSRLTLVREGEAAPLWTGSV
jgi:hypothetical protein